jgi:hypothetical protein
LATPYTLIVSGYAKKTTVQVETVIYNDRHKANMKVTVDEKEKSQRTRNLYLIFCQRTVSTFAKPHELTHNPIFAKELPSAFAQGSRFEILQQTGLCR